MAEQKCRDCKWFSGVNCDKIGHIIWDINEPECQSMLQSRSHPDTTQDPKRLCNFYKRNDNLTKE